MEVSIASIVQPFKFPSRILTAQTASPYGRPPGFGSFPGQSGSPPGMGAPPGMGMQASISPIVKLTSSGAPQACRHQGQLLLLVYNKPTIYRLVDQAGSRLASKG